MVSNYKMIFYYRLLGVVAMLSLAVSGTLLWVLLAWLGEPHPAEKEITAVQPLSARGKRNAETLMKRVLSR